MGRIRAFIAAELPNGVTQALATFIGELQASMPSEVRWVRPENIHLTLKFLGNIEPESVQPLSEVVDRCVASITPFDLYIEELGAFPALNSPKAIWVGLGGQLHILRDLQLSLDEQLVELGYDKEIKYFIPHLTIGRTKNGMHLAGRKKIGLALSTASVEIGASLPVKSLSLLQTTLTPLGSIYTQLFSTSMKHRA